MKVQKQVWFSEDTLKKIEVSENSRQNFSARIALLIDVANELSRDCAPTLKVSQWLALTHTSKTYEIRHELDFAVVIDNFFCELIENSAVCNQQFGVDCKALAAFLQSSPKSQQWAAFEIAGRFWRERDVFAFGDDYQSLLLKLGAKIAN